MGKNYLVTSGTDGIGRSIVETILNNSQDMDDHIIVNYGHNDQKAECFLSDNKRFSDRITLMKADLSTYEGMELLVQEVLNRFDYVDGLVCNTGIGTYEKFDNYTWDIWNNVINTNLSIPAFLLQKLKYAMRKKSGSIVMIGSSAGIRTYSSSIVYSVSKAGVIHLTKCMVKEFEPLCVRINAVAPGFIETSWQNGRSQESYDRINRKIAMHRFGMPEEVANMVFELLNNTYVNGTVVEIDGGYEYF